MAFQSTVSIQQGFGVPGEMFTDSPHTAQTYTIVSASSALNIIGQTCCTITSQGVCEAGAGGSLGFAGFLVNPKVEALYGTVGQPLAPSMTIPNNNIAELLTMGQIIVQLPAAAAIGDYVIFDDVSGAIETIAPTDPLPTGKTFANAIVSFFTPNAVGSQMAVITVNPTFVIPQPA